MNASGPARRTRLVAATALVLALAGSARAQTDYPLGPESERQPGVPEGTVTKHAWTSRIYPGTQRDYWVYVPAQYRAGTPAALMVFQDGGRFVAGDGRWRIPIVFDNMIQKGEMPVTIGLFVDPGVVPARSAQEEGRYDRSFEYDALGDRYARFLVEELLPEVGKTYTMTSDPSLRGLAGSSSGGICAFTAAWNRPDAFRRVLSFIGSYTGLRGGDAYATLVRKTEPRPIRVFLEDGSRDLDIYSGNWWLGNQTLASALEYAGYDVRFVPGDRGHDGIHGSAILPDALRWLWRDWTQPIVASKGKPGAERHYATEIVDPAATEWQKVATAEGAIVGLTVDAGGDVYFSDGHAIRRLEHATARTSIFRDGARTGAIRFGPDHRLYAVSRSAPNIVAYTERDQTVVARAVEAQDLVVGAQGDLWLSAPRERRIWHVDAHGVRHAASAEVDSSGPLALSPDQAFLATVSADGRWAWSYQVAPDGSLRHGQAFYRLEVADGTPAAQGPTSAAVDSEGFLYLATQAGVQAFDQPGRLSAILAGPPGGPVSKIVFGGPELDTLYASVADTLFRRPLRRRGVWPWRPVKPPVPRL